ncbi:uncharacterized protein Ecym_5602 [Eremothecium cymbalariae DBVPG|uniref:Uncharacterized protein n=1 Tax=Eremothecium cymbalariae (strain CBS 270.75 / DBVPG 7215 / KCTC 17166 / NRRL Y-17582) TaxID=931890 RepID=I6NE46_ERECY|nr:hypothetical protein Ecym_5602 [Eremothecium cymbalariae DBVPG\
MPVSQSSSRVESLQSKTLVIDADSAKAPVITMLLESASKEDLEDLELLDKDIIDMNTDVIDSGSQVQIRILDLPADIVYNPLQSDPTDRWTIGDSLGLTSPEQERHPLYFDQIDETPGSIEKAYAKLYYRSSEIVYSIIDLAKWVYSKCYQYYWYTLINLSVRYPKFGTWL